MENFKPKMAEGLSRAIKLLILVMGLSSAGNAFSQEKVSNMEQLINDAKKIEMVISKKVAKEGAIGIFNTVVPFAEMQDGSRISKVMYHDDERTKASSVLIGNGNFYYFDKDADGKVDAVYVDKNTKPLKIGQGSMKALMSMAGEITQTELDLSGDEFMQNKFVCFKLDEGKAYDTSDATISRMSDSDKAQAQETLQKLFNSALQSNLDNINK